MKKIDEVKNSLKKLEESIEKAVAFIEESVEAMRQEIAFINQKVSDLESRIDRIEDWPRISEVQISEEGTKQRRKAREKEAKPSEVEVEELAQPSRAPRGAAPVSYEEDVALVHASAGMVRQPPAPTEAKQPRATPSIEATGAGERSRGGIVEEQFVRPSAFLRKMSELEASMPQSALGPVAPQANLRLQISSVLESMRSGRPSSTPSPVKSPPVTAGGYAVSHTEEAVPPPPVPVQAQPAGGKTFRVPDNWLPECSRAKYYSPKNLDKGVLKDMEKKTKEIFVR
ncbi:MAG: hypothetical protein KIH01_06605 [Candidatus Freyarchaeota archaeon]|nr:hypothetical protein [Candidatus Jordarchaeia archaeon]